MEVKKVLVLAGGIDQIELIKGLRRKFNGVEVLLIDLAADVPAKEYADRHYQVSTMDRDIVLEIARKENIDLILVACGDQPLTTMAYVSEQLSLPCYLTYEQSLALTNKILMKEIMISHHIPTSKFRKVKDLNISDLSGFVYPLVVKPIDNNGSKGISKIKDEEDLQDAIREARKYTKSGEILIEEFKEGEEYSVEAFIEEGKPQIVIATKNIKIKDNNKFTILQNLYVPQISIELTRKIHDIVVKIGKAYSLNNVPLLIQMIVKDDEVNVIEFSARTGGGSKLQIIKEMTGVDIIDNLIDITVGNTPRIDPVFSNKHAAINYIYANSGIFSGVGGLNNLLDEDYIRKWFPYKNFGVPIVKSEYSSDRPAGFLVVGNTREDLKKKIAFIDKTLQIQDENGNDIMIHGLYEKAYL